MNRAKKGIKRGTAILLAVTLLFGLVSTMEYGKITAQAATGEKFAVDGIVYQVLTEEDGNYTVAVTGNELTEETNVVIPSTVSNGEKTYDVVSIGARAFGGCIYLTGIIILDGVTMIDARAFMKCTALTNVELPKSVTIIGNGAFFGCFSLTSITIRNGVTTIEDNAFYECRSLTGIVLPDSVITIGDGAFRNCISLTSIDIPESVTSIGGSAFAGCASLTSIDIPDGVTAIGNYAFSDCMNLASMDIPDGVITIGEGAFYWCSSLTDITIPDGVTAIADKTFYACESLIRIDIPDGVTSIGAEAFLGCRSLTSIDIPDGVTAIGNYAFSDCKNLASIDIPDGVTTIGEGAFCVCDALEYITVASKTVTYESEDVIPLTVTMVYGFADSTTQIYCTDKNLPFTAITYVNEWTTTPSISGWIYGDTATTPTYEAKYGNDTVVVEYRLASGTDDDYTTTVPSDSGDYKVRFTVEAKDGYSPLSTVIDLTIAKREVTITADDQNISWGDFISESGYTISGLASGDTLSSITITSSTAEVTDAGSIEVSGAKIVNSNDTEVTANYAITYVSGTLVIQPATMDSSATGYEGIYDGEAHGITVNVTNVDDATITYSMDEGAEYTSENPAFTDVGTYTVYYKIEKENYTTVEGSATVKITKREMTITADNQTIIVGGSIDNCKYTAIGLLDGHALVSVTLTPNTTEVTSSGTIMLSGAKIVNADGDDVTANYDITYVAGTLVIEETEYAVPIIPDTGDNTPIVLCLILLIGSGLTAVGFWKKNKYIV